MDSEGQIYIKNRIKESINFGKIIIFFMKFKQIKMNAVCYKGDLIVFPSEVEANLRKHENIIDANVFSITNGQGVDLCGCAWIVLKDKSKKPTLGELQAMCSKRVLQYIKFVDDFPTNENGKTSKIEMSRLYKQELNL